MFGILSGLKGVLRSSETITDDWVFKLHYKFTSYILVAFSAILCTNQFFGNPINCMAAFKDEIPQAVMDSYCWIRSTFTLPGTQGKVVGVEIPHPGMDTVVPGEPIIYHAYYQWVVFFLFFQSGFFYIPRFLWKNKEGGKLQKILQGLRCPILGTEDVDVDEKRKDEENGKSKEAQELIKYPGKNYRSAALQYQYNRKILSLAQYLKDTKGCHGMYAWFYFSCELLNFVNVVGQIFFTNTFLGGEFTTYGTRVIQFANTDQMNRTDPMVAIFPRVTKCTFNRFGPSGNIQNNDLLCVLPINIINEKIFIFLWFWFIILSVVSAVQVFYRLPFLFSNGLRWRYLAINTSPGTSRDIREIGSEMTDVSDWLVLKFLRTNMNPINFQALMRDLAKKLDELDTELAV